MASVVAGVQFSEKSLKGLKLLQSPLYDGVCNYVAVVLTFKCVLCDYSDEMAELVLQHVSAKHVDAEQKRVILPVKDTQKPVVEKLSELQKQREPSIYEEEQDTLFDFDQVRPAMLDLRSEFDFHRDEPMHAASNLTEVPYNNPPSQCDINIGGDLNKSSNLDGQNLVNNPEIMATKLITVNTNTSLGEGASHVTSPMETIYTQTYQPGQIEHQHRETTAQSEDKTVSQKFSDLLNSINTTVNQPSITQHEEFAMDAVLGSDSAGDKNSTLCVEVNPSYGESIGQFGHSNVISQTPVDTMVNNHRVTNFSSDQFNVMSSTTLGASGFPANHARLHCSVAPPLENSVNYTNETSLPSVMSSIMQNNPANLQMQPPGNATCSSMSNIGTVNDSGGSLIELPQSLHTMSQSVNTSSNLQFINLPPGSVIVAASNDKVMDVESMVNPTMVNMPHVNAFNEGVHDLNKPNQEKDLANAASTFNVTLTGVKELNTDFVSGKINEQCLLDPDLLRQTTKQVSKINETGEKEGQERFCDLSQVVAVMKPNVTDQHSFDILNCESVRSQPNRNDQLESDHNQRKPNQLSSETAISKNTFCKDTPQQEKNDPATCLSVAVDADSGSNIIDIVEDCVSRLKDSDSIQGQNSIDLESSQYNNNSSKNFKVGANHDEKTPVNESKTLQVSLEKMSSSAINNLKQKPLKHFKWEKQTSETLDKQKNISSDLKAGKSLHKNKKKSKDISAKVTSEGEDELKKSLTCAYCGEVFQSVRDCFNHYENMHEDGLNFRVDKTNNSIQADHIKRRREKYIKSRIDGTTMDDFGLNYGIRLDLRKFLTEMSETLDQGGSKSYVSSTESEDSDNSELNETGMDNSKTVNKYSTTALKRKATLDSLKSSTCPMCYLKFKPSNIEKHIALVHYWARISRPKRDTGSYICHVCGKSFKHRKNLEAHERRIHQGKKRYESYNERKELQCSSCDYKTKENRRLQSHVETVHMGLKPFKCQYCDYVCSERTSLKGHMYRHFKMKPITCNYCDYGCIQRNAIKSHLKSKHGIVLDSVRACEKLGQSVEEGRNKRLAILEDHSKHMRFHNIDKTVSIADVQKVTNYSDIRGHSEVSTKKKSKSGSSNINNMITNINVKDTANESLKLNANGAVITQNYIKQLNQTESDTGYIDQNQINNEIRTWTLSSHTSIGNVPNCENLGNTGVYVQEQKVQNLPALASQIPQTLMTSAQYVYPVPTQGLMTSQYLQSTQPSEEQSSFSQAHVNTSNFSESVPHSTSQPVGVTLDWSILRLSYDDTAYADTPASSYPE